MKSDMGAMNCFWSRRSVRWFGLAVVAMDVLGTGVGTIAAAEIQFNRDVRPILSENCFSCHGADPGSRKATLRLDTREGLFDPTPKRGPAVVAGDPGRSELWKRITATDPDEVMPPPKSHKELKSAQKDVLKRWIVSGAPWQGHWSFIKPERPPTPAVSRADWVRNPIDAFVLSRLEAKKLSPAPEADRRTLARRLALDLTGLPPKPEEVEGFVRDRSRDAYEKWVMRWMDSPRWGEHRARAWLDAARYADTHGLHFDNYREIWPYRDYVIRSFNLNRPFDRFIVEQIAGDLLPDPTDEQLIATGFHRCNMTTNEGGTIEEENLANYANDRVTTTGWVFLGLTANCGACHDHKFDPFTTRDFYSMAAFFRNTKQGGFDRNRREGDVSMVVPPNEADRLRWKALGPEIEAAKKLRDGLVAETDKAFTNWVRNVSAETLPREVEFSDRYLRLPLTEGSGTNLAGQANGNSHRFRSAGELEWRPDGPLGPAPVFAKGRTIRLGDFADFEMPQPFSVSGWVRVPEDFKGEASVLARMGGEEENFRGWDFYLRDDHFGLHLVNRWPSVALQVRTEDKSLKRGEWHHLCATYDGSTHAEGVKLFIDGLEMPVKRNKDSLQWSMRTPFPLRVGGRERGFELPGVAVQDLRLYQRVLDPSEAGALAASTRLPELIAKIDFASTNNPAREVMRQYFRATQHGPWQAATMRLLALEGERERIRGRSAVTQIQIEKEDSEPTAQILFRGQYDKPRDKVTAATPAFLHPMPAGAPRNRLGLAQWLVSPENPLTSRVLVNRFWQEVFGTGLVKTTEDFGAMGEMPLNQELLDWLAVEFRESGWDVRHLFQLMLTSATYRQSAVTTPEKLERDPQNRLLSRGPRFRMDAEMVRDYALAASGLLVEQVGGPSVKPYQPDGVWEAVAMPESDTRYYTADTGPALYRRSLYTFWKRAAPPALMDIFNAPSREVCTVRRERTNTPLQALATLNDPEFIEAARHLAEAALVRSALRTDPALDDVAARLLARPVSKVERAILKKTLSEARSFYEQQPAEAMELLGTGSSRLTGKVPAPMLAALSVVANQIMNLDEVLNK